MEHQQKNTPVYGLVAIGGFMVTMLCYVLIGCQTTKLELVVTFGAWIIIEMLLWGIWHLFIGIRKITCHFSSHYTIIRAIRDILHAQS